jgi:hypothetical protein
MADQVLQDAIRLLRAGFAVHWLAPASKAPIEGGWAQRTFIEEDELVATYKRGFNVGFRPGKWSVVEGREICVIDVDVRGGERYEQEAHCAAQALLEEPSGFTVITGSGVGRHLYIAFEKGVSPDKAATTLRQSDVYVTPDFEICDPYADDARPAWLIELLSTGKNVVMPPSIHPDTGMAYRWTR